jgi:hypothetical protein
MVALGAATMVAALPAVPASGAEALPLAPHTAAPPDDAGGPRGPSAELPRTVTGHDGFVVLGLALVAISAVALVTAVHNRPSQRRRRRRPHEMW